ncbi:MAG TPA: MlaD family protein, partial [Nitrospiria bacterium]
MRLSAEAKVGLAVLAGVLILAVMTITVGGYRFGTQGGYRIYAVFKSAAGLDTKSSIKVAGVEVGKVEAITLVNDKARVTLRIRPEVQLRKGAQTALRATGLLGEKYVELLPGAETGFLKEGDTLSESQESADLDKLIAQFSDIAVDIKAVSASLREALGSEEGKTSLKKIVGNVRDVTQSLKDELPRLLASLNSASEKLEAIAIKVE